MIVSLVQFLLHEIVRVAILLVIFVVFRRLFWSRFSKVVDRILLHLEHCHQLSTDESGIVYLFQFHRTPRTPNASPYCCKVEAFLRFHKIPYKAVYTLVQRSPSGVLPYVILDGKVISHADVIIATLEKKYELSPSLSESEKAVSRSVDRMIDGNVANAIFYYKVLKNGRQLRKYWQTLIPYILTQALYQLVRTETVNRLDGIHFSKKNDVEIRKGLIADLEALETLIGNKRFLFGEEPTAADFGLFAHLSSVYGMPFGDPITGLLDERFPRLKKHTTELFTLLFPEYHY